MPKKLDLKEIPPVSTTRFEERYSIDEYLDGSVWEFVQGDDFEVKPSTFYQNLRTYAKRRGIELEVRQRGEKILLQYTGNSKR
jgi:hypothetical protein